MRLLGMAPSCCWWLLLLPLDMLLDAPAAHLPRRPKLALAEHAPKVIYLLHILGGCLEHGLGGATLGSRPSCWGALRRQCQHVNNDMRPARSHAMHAREMPSSQAVARPAELAVDAKFQRGMRPVTRATKAGAGHALVSPVPQQRQQLASPRTHPPAWRRNNPLRLPLC